MSNSKYLFTTYNYLVAIELVAELEAKIFPKFDQDAGDDASAEGYNFTILQLANKARREIEILEEMQAGKR